MISHDWNEETKKYFETMDDAALDGKAPINVIPLNHTVRDYYLYVKDSYYERYIRDDGNNKVTELLRNKGCTIKWCILSCAQLKDLPAVNGDMLSIHFDVNKFEEQFEELLMVVTKVRITKIFDVTKERLKDEHYELLQILADKGGTIVKHCHYNLNSKK